MSRRGNDLTAVGAHTIVQVVEREHVIATVAAPAATEEDEKDEFVPGDFIIEPRQSIGMIVQVVDIDLVDIVEQRHLIMWC